MTESNNGIMVVGIGASAGGLEAITDLFDNIPSDTGLAFVIIQHLSPDFKSLMNELLAKHTTMEIHVIDGDTEVESNCVYLISSKHNIVFEDGIIKQIDRQPTSILNLPIDIFFHSLGKNIKDKSIGVILSGTGTDGSRGIRTIKEEGGCVFAQDPRTAQFDGMPNTAISTGVVDSILSPYALAEKIISLAQKAKKGADAILNMELESDLAIFTRILILVEKETGVNFREYRKSTLLRRLEKRMYLTHISDVNQYYEFMLSNLEETNALYKEFLIGVTRFFRDEDAFKIIEENVIPTIFSGKKTQDNIRVWCVGCSTGEEAYSVAILLSEYINRTKFKRSFKIFATDLDKNAIRKASAGMYPENIIADMPVKILEKYFTKVGNSFRIVKSIRDHLVFTAHDALRDPPFINMDMIVCRNMMIYINPSVQKNLLTNFQFALNFHGFLFLGPSESITPVKRAFRAIDNRWNIFRNISNEKPLPFPKERIIGLSNKYERKLKKEAFNNKPTVIDYNSSPKYDDFIAREISEQYGPRSLFVNTKFEIIYINGDFKDILEFPRAFANMNLLTMIDPNEELLFRNGVRKMLSGEGEQSSIYKDVQLKRGDKVLDVDVRFSKFTTRSIDENLVWIEFKINDLDKQIDKETGEVIRFDAYKSERFKTLEQELRQVKNEKQYLVEQLETTNEELQSSNEELMAANEELQSTNEELQSVNEELYTVNTELQSKITELIISNNDITNLLSSTDIGTIFLDLDLRIRKFTPALSDQFDLEESDLGRPIFNFSNNLEDDIYDEINEVLKTRVANEREIKDKQGNCFLMRMLPYWANEKTLDGVVISFINLNEITQARQEVDEKSRKFETLLAHTNDIITMLDTNGIVTSVNTGKANIFDPSMFVGKLIYELEGEYNTDIMIKAIDEVRKTKIITSYAIKYTHPVNKQDMWFKSNLVPILQKEGEIESFMIVAHDITAHKEIEDKLKTKSKNLQKKLSKRNNELEKVVLELKEVNSYLDSFVHGAAHDLRAPIAQMKGMMNLLPKVKDEEQVKKILKQFGKSVVNMDSTLSGLIELIEFQKNTGELISSVDLIEAFHQVKSQLSDELEEAEGVIKIDCNKTCKINFIPAYIQSVFYNLLSNAIKYRSYTRPLEIHVTIKKEMNFYLIEVKDNGIGMDLTKYDHLVFQPFKRLTMERDGIGIGLSIINSAVKKAGGRIEVESRLDKGSTFTVLLAPMKKIKVTQIKNKSNHAQTIEQED